MLRDSLPTYQSPIPSSLSVSPTIEVDGILKFVDSNISAFCNYYKSIKDSDRENRITDFLVHHFQVCKSEQSDGFFPFDFRKNPTQPESAKETDIGVFVLTRKPTPIPIIEFEAKRFSSTSTSNKQYVSGESRGGIERFKRGHHSSHLLVCGMIGYVQSPTSTEWIGKVNGWIEEEAARNVDTTIDWKTRNEKLIPVSSFINIEKLKSEHTRKQSNDSITLWHFFINLC